MVRDRLSMNEGWRFYEGEIGGVRNRWAWGKSGSWNQGPESIEDKVPEIHKFCELENVADQVLQ